MVALVGASPVFVDVLPSTFNMDPASLQAAIALVQREGKLAPKAVMPVDLFGQPADYRTLAPIAAAGGLKLLCDTAQGFGGLLDGKRAGVIGDAAATSFFPAKPLGCYGDGGAVFPNDDGLKELLLSLRMHGQGSDRYEHVRIGLNSRLDTIQAAILIEKLKIFPDEIDRRNAVAKRYNEAFAGSNRIVPPLVIAGATSTWAPIHRASGKPQANSRPISNGPGFRLAVYYPIPLSRQKAYGHYPSAPHPGQRGLVAQSRQPADASLSGDGGSGPNYRRCIEKRWIAPPLPSHATGAGALRATASPNALRARGEGGPHQDAALAAVF